MYCARFFRNQPKSKPVVATAEYDHNKQLIAVKEFENRHYSRPNEESETEPLDHTLDMVIFIIMYFCYSIINL